MTPELATFWIACVVAFPIAALLKLPTKQGRHVGPVPVPRIGGFAIVAGFLVAPVAAALISDEARRFVTEDSMPYVALAGCGGIVFAIGAWDDFRDLPWWLKLGAQVAAATALWAAGFRVGELTLPNGSVLRLSWADPLVTVFWLVLVTNAMNLIDGRDGLAAGVAILASLTMTYVAWDLGHDLIAMLFAALAGGALGFLPFNFPRARRFLGDSGAYFLGFALGALSIAGFVDSTGRVPLYIPLVALGLPILDTGVSFLRRFLDRRNPFEPDRDHVHDRIARLVGDSSLVALVIYGVSAVFCAAALGLHQWYKAAGSAVVGGAVVAFALALIVVLGYGSTFWNSSRVVGWRLRRPSDLGPGEVS